MAVKNPNPLSCFFFFFSLASLFLSLSHSRELPNTHTLLDVSASLRRAHSVLSSSSSKGNSDSLHPSAQTLRSSFLDARNNHSRSRIFSLPLHPRHSFGGGGSRHQTYRSLLLARLARDEARVESLNTKLELAVNDVRRSDLRPSLEKSDEELSGVVEPEGLSTPVVSGISEGSGEYFTRIGVGSPASQYSMVLDTGSDVNWLQCLPCSDCYHQSDPIFDPSRSSSYSALSCESSQCAALDTSGCRAGSCLYQVSYGDGSYTVGSFVTETLSFGGGAVKGVALGCGHDNEGLFVGAAGLIGLGGGDLSLTRQIKASSFSYCLVNRDSTESSTLEFNSGIPSDSVLAPILRNRKTSTFYYVQMEGINVGGQPIPVNDPSVFAIDESGNGGIIVDSGTAVTRLRTQAYNSLRDSFRAMTQDLTLTAGVALFDTCYDLSSKTSVRVPTVSFRLSGGKLWQLPASNYLIPVDNAGTFCFAFAPTSSSLSIIGNVQQQGTRVTYDLATNRVGFSSNKC